MKFLWVFVLIINVVFGATTNGNGGVGSTGSSTSYTTPRANYWFDECFWSHKNDVFDTQNDYNGTSKIANNEKNSSVGGIIGKVANFTHISQDDDNDYDDDLIVLDPNALDGVTNFTIMMWIKNDQDDDKAFTLLSAAKKSGSDNIVWMYFKDNNHFDPKVNGTWSDAHNNGGVKLPIDLNDNEWHFVVWTRSGSDNNITIDDNDPVQFTIDDTDSLSVDGLVLAQDQDKVEGDYQAKQEYNGYMDEVKLYDKVLSTDEINNIYNNEKDRKNYDGSTRYMPTCPMANYQLDECFWEGKSGEVKDKVRDEDISRVNGFGEGGATTIKKGTCHSGIFSSSDSQDVNISSNSKFQMTDSQGYMFWVKVTQDNNAYILTNGVKNNSIEYKNGKIVFNLQFKNAVRKPTSVETDSDIRLNKWYQVTAVYYREDDNMTLYINGEYNNSKDVSDDMSTGYGYASGDNPEVEAGTGNIFIASDGENKNYLDGYVDEVKFYDLSGDYNLTPKLVKQIYDFEYNGGLRNKNYTGGKRLCYECPIANYHFDKCFWDDSDGDVIDYSKNKFNATSQIVKEAPYGQLCRDANFTHISQDDNNDSEDDVIKDVPKEVLNQDQNFTIMAWIKTTQDGNFTILAGVGSDSKSEDELRFYFKDGGDTFMPWIKNDNTQIDTSSKDINDGEWHHIVWTRDVSSDTPKHCIYIDGSKIDCATIDDDDGSGLNIQAVAIGQDLDNDGSGGYQKSQEFNGFMDELKVYSKVLTRSEIKAIYANEVNHLNYDGTDRRCILCFGFDCWDEDNLSKRFITTKIVNKEINITINSLKDDMSKYQEFNGTVCSVLIDENGNEVSDWNKTSFRFDTNKSVRFNVDRAEKNISVRIEWKRDEDVDCPINIKHLEVNSTDNFAIRPKEFNIDDITQILYAGQDFNITFYALDENGNDTTDYNETNGTTFYIEANDTKVACKTGVFKAEIKFENGKNTTTATYDEIGDINITIKEKNDSAFAKVDNDDTNDTQRLITPKTITLHFKPYKTTIKTSFNKRNIVDIDNNLSQSSMDLNLSLEIQNKNGDNLDDFNSTCYGQDVNITFFNKQNKINEEFVGVYYDNNGSNSTLQTHKDINFSRLDSNWTIGVDRFKNGEAELNISFNVERNRSIPISIKDINFTDINVTTPKIAYIQNPIHPDKNISFYYLKVTAPDIYLMNKNEKNETMRVIVFDENHNHLPIKELVDWYVDENYTKDEISILGTSTNYTYNSDKNVSNFEVNITKNDYEYNISIKNKSDDNKFVVIHFKTPKYMWYSKYEDYNDSNGSSCSSHYCIEFNYKKTSTSNMGVGSGKFYGSEVNNSHYHTKERMGVKIYR